MCDPDIITHVNVERAQEGGYHYLHESGCVWHHGRLYVGFANHPLLERNIEDEVIRGRVSDDGGMTWGPTQMWAQEPMTGGCSFNHPVFASYNNKLWGFFTRWEKDVELPRTEILQLEESTNRWQAINANIPTFIPFHPPMQTQDGNWIMAGESFWYEAAVAISKGDDWTQWELVIIPRREGLEFMFPETALIDQGDRLIAFCRPRNHGLGQIAYSYDHGHTWTQLQDSNYPMRSSQPCAGLLSTGQHFLITDHLDVDRHLLMIALTEPNGRVFKKALKIRHQAYPLRRHFGGYNIEKQRKPNTKSLVGTETEWSYPSAIEHEGKLYISYTQGKEDCVLSIIPINCLKI
jgi:hypothetical protein